MSVNIDTQIQQKEAELRPLRSRMEDLQLQFIQDTTLFAAEWYEKTAKSYVTKNPERTFSLAKEDLANMKRQVNQLSQKAPTIVKAALCEPNVWWHQSPDKDASINRYDQLGDAKVGNRFPEAIDKPVRRALGELGVILEKYGYNVATTEALKGAYPEFWYERTNTGPTLTRPFFPHLLEWSQEMQATLYEYNQLYKRAFALLKEIVDLKDEKRKRQASDLWDST